MNAYFTQPSRLPRCKERGFTLIELSVALLIGLFLLGGLLTLVQDMRRTFGAQSSMSQLQDSQRLAMTLIADVVQAAGYFPDPASDTLVSSFPAAAPFVQAGQAIAGTRNAAAPGDTITVQFRTQLNDGVINCTGNTNTVAPLLTFVNQFSVDAAGNLNCVLNNAAAVPLITGVQNMQILYGVKTNFAVVNNTVDSYLRADQVTAGNNWSNIISVKVTLTFTNPLAQGQPGQPATIPFTRVVTVMARGGVNAT
jgi:type IV pilus assembly protein PilW